MPTPLTPRGSFSLDAAAAFAERFPGTDTNRTAGFSIRWPVDDDWRTVTARLRQDAGTVLVDLEDDPPEDLVQHAVRDIERILSLDVDAAGFDAIGSRDPVVGDLQRRFPGLRPVLFFTPYEAAAWTIIGQRIRMTQAATVKQRLATEIGQAGAFPSPERLAALAGPQRGLTQRKVEQLRQLGRAGAEGRLGRDRLRALEPRDAMRELQDLPGVGPFGAELILVRGVGAPDVLPRHEPRLEGAAREAYGLAPDADIAAVADGWRPFRSWVGLLLRAALEAR